MDSAEEVDALVAFLHKTLELGLKQLWDPEIWGEHLFGDSLTRD